MAATASEELFIRQEQSGRVTWTIARDAPECKLAYVNNNGRFLSNQYALPGNRYNSIE